jgi:hypothetical protein
VFGKRFPKIPAQFPVGWTDEPTEKLFPRINACFIVRDKGGRGGEIAIQETDFRLAGAPMRAPRRPSRRNLWTPA